MKLSTTLILSTLSMATSAAFAAEPVIGLITKTETNPFFVKMKEGAQAEAKKAGAKLLTATGKKDGDTASQITALENMAAAGANHSDHLHRRCDHSHREEGAGKGRASDCPGQPV